MSVASSGCDQIAPKVGRPVILASASPWRRRLLKKHEIPVKIHPSHFAEKTHHESPRQLAVHNAQGKAREVAREYADAIVIGVDTIGVCGRTILLKPRDKKHARQMLQLLSGTTHRVISGLCLIDTKSGREISTAVTTRVTFRRLGSAELEAYLKSNQWRGKAGAYAIQARAKGFVKKIEGDITNVVGIPIPTVQKILMKIKN